ncbi:MAG: HAD family phosphatase [Flavobacteriaceae bacterium]|nr:HAD family phosphatase [Flavobacteriaceae bacterium]
MSIKLICSDIDGTLLNKDRELSQKTIHEIKRLATIPFILISSRMPKAMTHLQKELKNEHLPLIAYNGGFILVDGNAISSTEITSNTSEAIHDFCKKTNLHLSLYHNDEWYVPEFDYWAKRESNNTKITPEIQPIETTLHNWKSEGKGAHKIMVMGDATEIDRLVHFIDTNLSSEIIGYRSKDTYLEIAHRSISKKTAIKSLLSQHYPTLTMRNVLAFGDNYNDIEMLEAVGIGVAVANAKKEVLAVADSVTETNKEDGVANYLEKHLK